MSKRVKVSFDLDEDVLKEVERQHEKIGTNKAEFFRIAVFIALKEHNLKQKFYSLMAEL